MQWTDHVCCHKKCLIMLPSLIKKLNLHCSGTVLYAARSAEKSVKFYQFLRLKIEFCNPCCLVPVWRFPKNPSRSIHFGDVCKASRRETFSLRPCDPKHSGRAEQRGLGTRQKLLLIQVVWVQVYYQTACISISIQILQMTFIFFLKEKVERIFYFLFWWFFN